MSVAPDPSAALLPVHRLGGHLPPAAGLRIDLRTLAAAAIAALVATREEPDLAPLREAAAALTTLVDPTARLAALQLALAAPQPRDQGLARLALRLHLDPLEVLAVAVAVAVEEDPRLGRALACLQAPIAGSRPTIGLLDAALPPWFGAATPPSSRLVGGAAEQAGLIVRLTPEAPLAEQGLRVPTGLALALRPGAALWPGVAAVPPGLPLPASLRQAAHRHARLLQGAGIILAIRGHDQEERRACGALIAAHLGLRPWYLRAEQAREPGIGAGAWLAQALPIVELDPSPSDTLAVPTPQGWPGPLVVLCGTDGGLSVPAGGGTVVPWVLNAPPPAERARLWQTALGDGALPDLAGEQARLRHIGPGRIAALARTAQAQARLAGRATPTALDIAEAAWQSDAGMAGLAQPVRDRVGDEALVIPAPVRRELELLAERCRQREDLSAGLGAALHARAAVGVRALFTGAPGTGKTLAAGWLATRLGLPLWRIDLAAVSSKYIGETEKNLSRVFACAEALEVVLLFDEADALFGSRTEVRDASDRFANGTTNYLLTRCETFHGIALLTSNSRTRFDGAFARRLDALLDFPLPGPEERRALWRAHLGEGHGLSGVELNRLSAASDLAGGHIRGAVLGASLAARAAGRPIGWEDIQLGLAAEYRKLGRPLPAELRSAR